MGIYRVQHGADRIVINTHNMCGDGNMPIHQVNATQYFLKKAPSRIAENGEPRNHMEEKVSLRGPCVMWH